LWARIGRQYCRNCGEPVVRDTPSSAADRVKLLGPVPVQVTFPLPASIRVSHAAIIENLRALGFLRIVADGRALHLDELPDDLDVAASTEVLVVVDRVTAAAGMESRLAEAIQQAFTEGEGIAVVLHPGGRLRFTEHPACSACDTPALAPSPALFSFNNP